ncbi:hypothetical protein EVAR_50889_1 [Eumeta japonica]|uniref:Uncharacterized protein n=1 Tax=Eumeta variegata TaxID=151549 RepID=A0A4C1YDQ7_EUMVA|nr:hypothetical protein EVAR_50889_1 [Eumeta japonica]
MEFAPTTPADRDPYIMKQAAWKYWINSELVKHSSNRPATGKPRERPKKGCAEEEPKSKYDKSSRRRETRDNEMENIVEEANTHEGL